MAAVKPFRALRYDTAVAGPLEQLVAPPYDVISDAERRDYLARNEHNVVHLTLPESEEEAARLFRDWRERGVLARDEEPGFWWLSQDYVGPDGIARRREGVVASVRVEPYENRVILPHERTHAGPKEGRLRLLRAARAQLEPIFLLWDGSIELDGLGEPDLVAEEGGVTARLWRLDAEFGAALVVELADAQLLIADGHHRYETALAFHEEDGTEESAWLMAVIVPTDQEGLTIFPTHRVFEKRPAATWLGFGESRDSPEAALGEIEQRRDGGATVVLYDGKTEIANAPSEKLDVVLVDRLGHDGLSYTPNWTDAVRAVDQREAQLAVLLRPTPLDEVWAVARRGDVMPQKSTYFYPKLTSGLLFHPLD